MSGTTVVVLLEVHQPRRLWELTQRPEAGQPDHIDDVRVNTRDDHSAQLLDDTQLHPAMAARPSSISEDVSRSPLRMRRVYTDRFDLDVQGTCRRSDSGPYSARPGLGRLRGLSVRFAQNLTSDRPSTHGPAGFARATSIAAIGRRSIQRSDRRASCRIAFLDHPRNPRHPTPWCLIRSSAMGSVDTALLSDEPMTARKWQGRRFPIASDRAPWPFGHRATSSSATSFISRSVAITTQCQRRGPAALCENCEFKNSSSRRRSEQCSATTEHRRFS